MALTADQRHSLLADRSRDAVVITAAVADVLAQNSDATALDIETAFRDAAAQLCGRHCRKVRGRDRYGGLQRATAAGLTAGENRAALLIGCGRACSAVIANAGGPDNQEGRPRPEPQENAVALHEFRKRLRRADLCHGSRVVLPATLPLGCRRLKGIGPAPADARTEPAGVGGRADQHGLNGRIKHHMRPARHRRRALADGLRRRWRSGQWSVIRLPILPRHARAAAGCPCHITASSSPRERHRCQRWCAG